MTPENTDATQNLPIMISDAAWRSILPFLKASENVYVGDPETCKRFLSALLWMTKEGAMLASLKNFITIFMMLAKSLPF